VVGRSRRCGWRGALIFVALGVLSAAVWVSPAAAVSPVAGVAKGRAPFPKRCPLGTSPSLPGNCLLNEGFDPCPSSTGAGCVRLGGGVLGKPVASEFRIAVSPSVTSVGRSLTVSLSTSLPRCTPALMNSNTRCWSQISFGDPRQRSEYLPLNYSAVFNPPLVRFPVSCQQIAGPMTCTGLVLRSFGPRTILFDHWMIVGAQIGIAGGGSASASGDYLETAVGLGTPPRVFRLRGTVTDKVTTPTTRAAGIAVRATGPHGQRATATTNSRGRYEFMLPRGTYTVDPAGNSNPKARKVKLTRNTSGVDFAEEPLGRVTLGPGGLTFGIDSITLGSAGAGGKVTFTPITVRKPIDGTSPKIISDVSTSRVFPTATVTVFKLGTTKARIVYNLTNARLEEYHLVGAGPTAAEAVTIGFSRITPTVLH
jgi:Type VI secretion system effector, Hcp